MRKWKLLLTLGKGAVTEMPLSLLNLKPTCLNRSTVFKIFSKHSSNARPQQGLLGSHLIRATVPWTGQHSAPGCLRQGLWGPAYPLCWTAPWAAGRETQGSGVGAERAGRGQPEGQRPPRPWSVFCVPGLAAATPRARPVTPVLPGSLLRPSQCRPHPETLYWIELCPPKRYVEALTPRTLTVTIFGNRLFANVIKMRSFRVGFSPV